MRHLFYSIKHRVTYVPYGVSCEERITLPKDMSLSIWKIYGHIPPFQFVQQTRKSYHWLAFEIFSTQNNSIIKRRLANSSHIIMGMMVQAFAELQILLKSVLHKRKRRENTLLTAKDAPFVSLTGCTPIRGPWYFFKVFDCSQSSIFPRDLRDRAPTVAGSHFDF